MQSQRHVLSNMSLSASELLKSTADRLHDTTRSRASARSSAPHALAFDPVFPCVWCGGGERDRTDDPLLAKQVLSQLSYTPSVLPVAQLLRTTPAPCGAVVGLVGLEPTTPALSRRCSNQLSYRPSLLLCGQPATLQPSHRLPSR